MSETTAAYEEKYGAWAGFTNGHKPDFARCCVEVTDYSTRWPRYHQCSKKRGHGPDGAYCKQHDPEAVKARRDASTARSNEKMNKERYGWYGRKFFGALQKIAEGHNDARGLAQEVVAEFKAGER
jgi:hypothetical protein